MYILGYYGRSLSVDTIRRNNRILFIDIILKNIMGRFIPPTKHEFLQHDYFDWSTEMNIRIRFS